jgi:GNAT superfamily N-acetyltransferase
VGLTGAAATPLYTAPTPITPEHRLDGFDCGKPALDQWLKARALDNEGRASRTYVVTATNGAQAGEAVGYYTLATGGVALSDMRGKHRHNMPNPVPVMVLGRLAVDHRHHGHGIGPALLHEAMQRTLEISRSAGVRMLMVHAIDDDAVTFYLRFGFHIFPAGSRTMFLLIETIASAL